MADHHKRLCLALVWLAISVVTSLAQDTPTAPPPSPTATPPPTATVAPVPCVAIIGDSSARGTLVVEVPGSGFPVVQTPPFSAVLRDQLNEYGIPNYGVEDYTVEAVGLQFRNDVAYTITEAYQRLLATPCTDAVIFPWINDLPDPSRVDPATAINAHVANLSQLIQTLLQDTNIERLILLNYYFIPYTDFGQRIYGQSTAPHIIRQMNAALVPLCADALAGPIRCRDIASEFVPLTEHLMYTVSSQEFYNGGYSAAAPEQTAFFTNFWSRYPTQALRADGAHLNSAGKRRLADSLINQLFFINP